MSQNSVNKLFPSNKGFSNRITKQRHPFLLHAQMPATPTMKFLDYRQQKWRIIRSMRTLCTNLQGHVCKVLTEWKQGRHLTDAITAARLQRSTLSTTDRSGQTTKGNPHRERQLFEWRDTDGTLMFSRHNKRSDKHSTSSWRVQCQVIQDRQRSRQATCPGPIPQSAGARCG